MSFIEDFPSLTAINLGLVPGYELVVVAGNNPIVPLGGAYVDLWDEGAAVDSFPTESSGAETWEIASSSPNDTGGGTGARQIVIVSIDINYEAQTTFVTMNGATPVTISGSHFRPRASAVVAGQVGTGRTNIGDITITDSSSGDTRLKMQADFGISQSTHYTVQSGKTVFTQFFRLWAPKDDDVIVRSRVRAYHATNPSELSVGAPFIYQNASTYPVIASFPLVEKTDFKLQVKSQLASSVAVTYDLLVVDNTELSTAITTASFP